VIYIQHDGSKGHPLETHTKGWEIHPSIKPAGGESVVRKRESDSFFETALQEELKKRGITHLVIAGGMTEYCVDTTCRRATSLGYDCHARKRCPPHARQRSAERGEHHRAPQFCARRFRRWGSRNQGKANGRDCFLNFLEESLSIGCLRKLIQREAA
jgi:nicotinamidase-related amidase